MGPAVTPKIQFPIAPLTVPLTNVAFTSDLHLGHDKDFIYEARGFATIEQHDEAILTLLHSLECDLLILVGDIMMGTNKVARIREFVDSLPCDVLLIAGNHDPKPTSLEDLSLDGFSVAEALDVTIDGFEVTLSHYPADFVDHRGRDFSTKQPPDDGRIVVHGHTHRKLQMTTSPSGTRQLHVGWDAWDRPVASDELFALLSKSS